GTNASEAVEGVTDTSAGDDEVDFDVDIECDADVSATADEAVTAASTDRVVKVSVAVDEIRVSPVAESNAESTAVADIVEGLIVIEGDADWFVSVGDVEASTGIDEEADLSAVTETVGAFAEGDVDVSTSVGTKDGLVTEDAAEFTKVVGPNDGSAVIEGVTDVSATLDVADTSISAEEEVD
ncbi:hypothetical protein BGZ72_005676, partial [Mortierella alpina]